MPVHRYRTLVKNRSTETTGSSPRIAVNRALPWIFGGPPKKPSSDIRTDWQLKKGETLKILIERLD